MSAQDKFKVVLMNMKQDDLFNFIWIYDQYVSNLIDYDNDEQPLNIEEFYNQSYKKLYK